MWNQQPQNGDITKNFGIMVVTIDRDKGSQYALKWAVENVLQKGQIVTLLHVKQKQSLNSSFFSSPSLPLSGANDDVARSIKIYTEPQAREIFIPFRSFCGRKDVQCNEVILEDTDISKALIEYCLHNAVENIVVSASSKNGLVRRFKGPDVATNLSKGCPDFCSVYVISKGKMLYVRSATRILPRATNPNTLAQNSSVSNSPSYRGRDSSVSRDSRDRSPFKLPEDNLADAIRSPFTRGRAANGRAYGEVGTPDCDISFVGGTPWANPLGHNGGTPPWATPDRQSHERPSFERSSFERPSLELSEFNYRLSNAYEPERTSLGSSERKSFDQNGLPDYSGSMSGYSTSSSNTEEFESEMRRLKLELKQTMDMYNAACKEAIAVKQKASELQRTKMEEAHVIEQEQTSHNSGMYRKYTFDEIEAATNSFSESLKIGEGGYGPVYRCTLDHTPAAIKVLRPDAAQGQSQFQQEVEILSCIRHPNMVLLLGACPEYGCLVYEHLANGSLEDRLFCKGNTPPLPWQLRFRIAAEIATGLLFLHQTKPEPLVHRDLKPANILLDRNFVSKISDVGLARLVPPSVADEVTEYRMTQAAGTFCYIDPEYQQSGMLGTKSDIYSLGILYLQLITAKPAMGLTHHVQRAIEKGTLWEMLDPAVQDWPYEQAMEFAKISLWCAQLRRKDRPDLNQILPQLERLRDFAEDNMPNYMMYGFRMPSNTHYGQSQSSTPQFSQDTISSGRTSSSTSMGSSL